MYYITISNGLLTDKHEKRMGSAIWRYMWFLDKVTMIDEGGKGYVLGGKPLTLEEIAHGQCSRSTVSRNLDMLEKNGYIETTRAPYGVIIRVLKAKKRFGKSATVVAEVRNPVAEVSNVIKTITVDNTDNNSEAETSHVPKVIKALEKVDPKNKTYYANKTQRAAAKFLISQYGLEEVLRRITFIPKTNSMPYMPKINSPNDLKEKWVKLEDALKSKRAEKSKLTPNYI